jgi:hypothetical protein
MTKVFVAQHPTEAHLVAGLLGSGGILTEVRGEALFGARGEVPVTPATLPSVWVLDDRQVDEALKILQGRLTEPPTGISADQSWKCSECGETVEPGFTTCWNCGAIGPGLSRSEAT